MLSIVLEDLSSTHFVNGENKMFGNGEILLVIVGEQLEIFQMTGSRLKTSIS
jgi:hypothetical protein